MKKIVDKVASNSLFLLGGSLFSTIFSFLFWLSIGKLLLPEDYGIISTTINFSIFLSIFSIFGFSYSLIKLLPEYLSKNQNQKTDSLLGFSLKFMFFSSLLIAILILLFSKILSNILNLPNAAIITSSAILIFITLATYFDSVLRGFQNMKFVAIIQILSQFSKLIISFLLIVFGVGYLGPLFGFLALYATTFLLGLKLFRIKFKSNGTDYKEILSKYSFPAFLSTILSYIFYSGRFLILNVIKSSSSTGIFSLAITMTAPLILLPNVLMQAILPISSELAINKKYRITLTSLISHFIKYTLLITLPLAIFLTIFSKQIILFLSRPEYLDSAKLFPILAVTSITLSLGGMLHQTLYALGRTKIYRNIMILSISIFLLLSIPLTYKFSELGMTFSVLIFSILYTLLSLIYLRNFVRISIPFLSIGKIIIATITSMGILYFLSLLNNGLTWGITSTLISLVVYVVLLILMRFLEKTDINLLKSLISKVPLMKRNLSPLVDFLYKLV